MTILLRHADILALNGIAKMRRLSREGDLDR